MNTLTNSIFAIFAKKICKYYNCSGKLIIDCNIPSASNYEFGKFYGSNFSEVIIGNNATAIGDNAFYGCTALKNVTIGNGVTQIGDYAFSGCSSLDSFTFGTRVQKIGEEAFSDCNNMTSLTYYTIVPPTCGTQALNDINKWDCELIVPTGCTAAYQAADQWKDFFFLSETGIEDIQSAPTAPVDVYNLHGERVKTGVAVDEVGTGLSRGIYIVNGKKILVK